MKTGTADSTNLRGRQLSRAIALACSTAAFGASAQDTVLEAVIVSAQKRDQDVQSVPITMNVLGNAQLTDLAIRRLEDYVTVLPNVSYIQYNPSRSEMYVRGISSGGNSELGGASNVAAYLDEQPITTASTYLNPHIYDIERIELLAGPQGTLFGANAQSGAIRIISNKPDPTGFAAGYDIEGNSVTKGDAGFIAEGFVNFPVMQDRAAVRLVGWYKRDAGYIDNIAYSHTFRNQRIRDSLPPAQAGLAPDITVNNDAAVKENFNEAETIGGRAALRIDLNDNWTATAMVLRQELDSKGVWDYDPDDGDLKVTRLLPETENDEFTQASLTLTGKLGNTTLTYTGSHLDRHYLQDLDYSFYSDYYISYSYIASYYTCYVSYFAACVDPRMPVTGNEKTTRQNHELRLASGTDQRLRWLVGAFYEDSRWDSDLEFHIPAITSFSSFDANGVRINGAAIHAPDIYFTTDVVKDSDETAFFGQLEFDFTDKVSGSVSGRKFESNSHVYGFTGSVFFPSCCNDPADGNNIDFKSKDDDQVYRANLTYQAKEDVMLFVTYSEGYRPGGVNRSFTGPIRPAYKADFLESYEIGAKTTLLDGRLRLNGAVYFQQWDDFQLSQTAQINPGDPFITLTRNIGGAKSDGVEMDFTFRASDHWEVAGAASYNNAEITRDYWRDARDQIAGDPPDAEKGHPLPRAPTIKWNARVRFNAEMMGMPTYIQATYGYTGSSYNQFLSSFKESRRKQDSYGIANLTWGFDRKNWSAELFVANVTDERAEIFLNNNAWENRITTNRPRTVGVRFRQRF